MKATVTRSYKGTVTATKYLIVTREQAARRPGDFEETTGPSEVVSHAGKRWTCSVRRSEPQGEANAAVCAERPLNLGGGMLFGHLNWTLEAYRLGGEEKPPEPFGERFLDLSAENKGLVDLAVEHGPVIRREISNFGPSDVKEE